jgi:predicted SAM-dependent methyltransferase
MKLNIGSGQKRLESYQNIDKFPSEPNDIYGDLDQKIDLPDACADEVMLDNVIEHVESIVHAIKEVRRLLKIGGVVHIYTPHFTSHSSWRDPTHRHHLSYFSFDMFCKTRNAHYLGGKLFEMAEKKLSFGGGLSILGRLIFKISPEAYEKKFCFIFPASTLYIKLKAI